MIAETGVHRFCIGNEWKPVSFSLVRLNRKGNTYRLNVWRGTSEAPFSEAEGA